MSKQELFRQADVVSIHVILSDRTRGLVGAAELALMKPSARLVNTSRGPIVVEADLLAALASGRLRGATLDVFRAEPLPPASALWSHPRILITAHTASSVDPILGGRLIAENITAFRRGDTVAERVNIDQGY